MDAAIRLLADLVALPSVNPMGQTTLGPDHLEGRVSDYLDRWFRELGVAVIREPVAPGRDNILARYDAPAARRTILFDVHQDTVPTGGMTIAPFDPVIDGGRLYGRGACDIKGGMAAMLTAFARLVRERPAGSASVLLACTVDEEFTHIGSSRLAEQVAGIDVAIVAEPTRLDIVDRHKGAVRWKIRTHGVACHSSTPHLGDNAIYRMARVVGALAGHARDLAAAPPDPILGPPSLSVGRIEGGVSVNVVPDRCEVEIDRRMIPGETARRGSRPRPASHPSRVREPRWGRVPASLGGHADAGSECAGESPWLAGLSAAIERVGGRRPAVLGVPYGTDGGPLGESGLPCFVFGPGDIAQAHTKDEWVDVDQSCWGPRCISRSPANWVVAEQAVRIECHKARQDAEPWLMIEMGRNYRRASSEHVEDVVVALVELALVPGVVRFGILVDAGLPLATVVVAVERPLDLRDDPLFAGIGVVVIIQRLVLES